MRKLRYMLLWMPVLAAIPVLAADHPITVSGGSPLVIQHEEWVSGADDVSLGTKYDNAAVTYIEVKVDSRAPRTILFNHERCEVSLKYGAIVLQIQTEEHGRMLRIKTDGATQFSKHFRRRDKGTFESLVSDRGIENLQILKTGVDQQVPAPSGHVEIVIHYED
jgi:hypothetical protein